MSSENAKAKVNLSKKTPKKASTSAVASNSSTKTKQVPTPKRKDQESKNARPLVASAAPKVELTKEQKKEERDKRRAQDLAARAKMHEAYTTGDERHLPLKDRGAARKMARELCDAQRSPAEFFLPTIIAVLLISTFTTSRFPIVAFIMTVAVWVYIIIIAMYLVVRTRQIKRKVTEKYGQKEDLRGLAFYAVSRMTQLRAMRLPKVGV